MKARLSENLKVFVCDTEGLAGDTVASCEKAGNSKKRRETILFDFLALCWL